MGRDLRLEATAIADAFDNTRHEGCAIEHVHLARHADICVDQGVVVRDHVFVGCIRGDGVLEGIGGALEQQAPEWTVDEMEEC